jgi:hypothetical protein
MERNQMIPWQDRQEEKSRVQEGVPKGLLTVAEAAQRLRISE